MLRPMLFLLLSLLLLLSGCKVEMYSGLSEDQANQMLSTLLRRGIEAEKQAAGKNGYTLLVDDDQLVRALQVLKENSLPREAFKNLGEVFAGDGMISSTSEVQARMSYALSQELADTLSRIDGVLTARVHVVLGVNDKVNNITIGLFAPYPGFAGGQPRARDQGAGGRCCGLAQIRQRERDAGPGAGKRDGTGYEAPVPPVVAGSPYARPAAADAGHGGRSFGPGRGRLGLRPPSAGSSSRGP